MSNKKIAANEESVREALAEVPELAGKNYAIKRINAGITNINWMITMEECGARFFVKVHGDNTDMYINRVAAVEATQRTANVGYGPRIIYASQDGSIEVHEFLEDFHSCNVADMLDPTIRANIAEAYRVLHGVEVLSVTQTGFEQLHERYGQAKEFGARLPKDMQHLLWQCSRVEEAIKAAGMDLSMCFNDAYVTNYMVDEHKNVKIIDLEYATNNDAYWDLALFGAETFYEGGDEMRELIEIHDGQYTVQAEARTTLYYGVALTTWGCWASLQAKLSSIPFDFAKYSELLHLRARHQMASPRWEQALLCL